jgi:hypothetical protein
MMSDILSTTKRVRKYRSNMTCLHGSETLMRGIQFSQRELPSPVSMSCVVQCYRLQGFIRGKKLRSQCMSKMRMGVKRLQSGDDLYIVTLEFSLTTPSCQL